MKAVMKEFGKNFYLGEVHPDLPHIFHGKGVVVWASGYLYECWWVKGKKQGKGRMIHIDRFMQEG